MKAQIGIFDIEWLLARHAGETSNRESSHLLQETKYNIPLEIGVVYASRFEVCGGVDLYMVAHHLDNAPFGELIPMFDARASHPEQVFGAQIWLSGMGCQLEYWNGRQNSPVKVLVSPGQDVFRFEREVDVTVQVAGGGVSETCSVYVSEAMLLNFLGDSAVNCLLERLGLTREIKAVVRPMPVHLALPLKEAMSSKFAGPARRLFAQARIMDYLGGLINHVYSGEVKSGRRHTARVRELYEYLLALEGRLPTLSDLAKTFGLSAKQLNCEFVAEFGQSIHAFVTARRLEHAHEALLEGVLPMKVLSERLGYSHVNHFNAAFRKKFGYPPGSLRRR